MAAEKAFEKCSEIAQSEVITSLADASNSLFKG